MSVPTDGEKGAGPMPQRHVVSFVVCWLLVVCLASPSVFARTSRIPSSVGPAYVSFRHEHQTPGGLDQHGDLGGVRTRHSWGLWPRGVGTLETYAVGGRTDNQGATFTGTIDDTSSQGMVKLQWNMGYAVDLPGYSIVPYGGLGGRGWRDEIEGPNGYDRTTLWAYLPVGIYLIGTAEGRPRAPVFKLEYRELIDGNVDHNLDDVGFFDVDTEQDEGHGVNVTVSGYVHRRVQIEGFYEFWDVGASEAKTVGGLTVREPRSETTMIGVSLGYVF